MSVSTGFIYTAISLLVAQMISPVTPIMPNSNYNYRYQFHRPLKFYVPGRAERYIAVPGRIVPQAHEIPFNPMTVPYQTFPMIHSLYELENEMSSSPPDDNDDMEPPPPPMNQSPQPQPPPPPPEENEPGPPPPMNEAPPPPPPDNNQDMGWKQSDDNKGWKQSDDDMGWKQSDQNNGWKQSDDNKRWKQSDDNMGWEQSNDNKGWKQSNDNKGWKQSDHPGGWGHDRHRHSERHQEVVHRHVSVHVPPKEFESDDNHVRIIRPRMPHQPKKHVNIIFIKAPSADNEQKTEVILPETPKQKTIVYVLVKRPDPSEGIRVRGAVPTKPSTPEVHFIRYKPNIKKQEEGYQKKK